MHLIKHRQMKKRIFGSLLMGFLTVSAMGQVSKTLSPYSQFGLGTLADQSQSFGRGMAGLSMGVRNGKYVNVQNPASYSSIDSLTMILDLGVSGQITNFKEGGRRLNAKTADFDYAVAAFRVLPKMGASFGVIPYSNIGYNYTSEGWIGEAGSEYYASISNNYYGLVYDGSGGFSQAFIGLGWEIAKGLSVGANVSYFWGKYERSGTYVPTDTYQNTLMRTYSTNINSWKLDFGAQYSRELNKDNLLTVGATFGLGHKLGANANLEIIGTNPQTAVSSTKRMSVDNAFELPMSFGAGLTLVHKNSLTIGADYMMQKWGSLDYPVVELNGDKSEYLPKSGLLKDRHKVVVGADWIPNQSARSFFKRVHYRMGVSYATPYYNINRGDGVVHNGPKELCVSAGFGIPIVNTWNNRTSLNISAQWVHTSAKDLITENCFRINIGLTFNERWFAKWKVD